MLLLTKIHRNSPERKELKLSSFPHDGHNDSHAEGLLGALLPKSFETVTTV